MTLSPAPPPSTFRNAARVNAERSLLDHRSGPGTRHQLIMRDQLASAFDQRCQKIEGPTAETYRLPVRQQYPLNWYQLKRTEREYLVIHRTDLLSGYARKLRLNSRDA